MNLERDTILAGKREIDNYFIDKTLHEYLRAFYFNENQILFLHITCMIIASKFINFQSFNY